MSEPGHNSADARLRSFIDRVLRLKEEQDALADDIREVYAEAKGEGYDKTAMGALVSHLRKIEKKGADAVGEAETIFDLYLDAYRRASGTDVATRAHTHEIDREARGKQRFSESMDDAKALSAEAAALGLIDPAAHAETERIADALADKLGAGVITDNQDQIGRNGPDLPVEASTEKQAAGASRPTPSNSAAHSPAERAGEAPSSSQASPATDTNDDGDDDVPAFIKQNKPDCLKLKDGHCRLSFATSALCAECNQRRAMARALV